MNRSRFSGLKILFVTAVFASGVYAEQKGWIDRFFSKQSAASTPLVEPPASVKALQDSFANVVDAVKPAVVNISAIQVTRVEQDPNEFYYGNPNEFWEQFFGGEPQQRRRAPREYRQEGTGSGVLIDPDGFILTNNHVVQGATQLTVTLADEKTYKGKVVGLDARTDLAVIRIKGNKPFPFVPLGDSSKARVGDWVLALGSPFGLEQTVTSGIISAIRQSLNIEGKVFRNLLQTDASINRGNSGGALVNMRGELVGINTAIYAPTGVFAGIGFAIPVNDAKLVLRDLIEKGYVQRSWMGVEIAQVDEVLAQQFGLSSAEGALVNSVLNGSPADKAGVKRGDVIVEFDGKKMPTVTALQDQVASTPPGRNVQVKVIRGGNSKVLSLKTESAPKEPSEAVAEEGAPAPKSASVTVEWLGASFSNMDAKLAQRYGLAMNEMVGVVIVKVPEDSLAEEAGLREGDLVRAVNQMTLAGTGDIAKVKKQTDPKKGLVFDVQRQGRSFYLSYKSLQ